VGGDRCFPTTPEFVASVNVSPRQLAEADLLDTVAGVLSATGLAPQDLCLEVFEGSTPPSVVSGL